MCFSSVLTPELDTGFCEFPESAASCATFPVWTHLFFFSHWIVTIHQPVGRQTELMINSNYCRTLTSNHKHQLHYESNEKKKQSLGKGDQKIQLKKQISCLKPDKQSALLSAL